MIGRDELARIAKVHIEELWALGRSELAWELYAPDVVDHQPAPGQRPGIEGIVDVLQWLRDSLPDLRMTIHAYVIEPPFAAEHWTMTGTHTGAPFAGLPALGHPIRFHGGDVIKVRDDGLISDVWHVEEFWRLRDQVTGKSRAADLPDSSAS